MSDRPDHLAGGVPASGGQLILERRFRLIRSLLGDRRKHLLDFGCGNGAQTMLLVNEFEETLGLDVKEEYLRGFLDAARFAGLEERCRGVIAPDGIIPLPDESVDVVTCFTVLEHVPDERTALAEMRRVLRPAGRLILTVPNRWWIFETHGADLPLLRWNRVPLVSWWPKKLHDRYARARIYRRRDVENLVTEAGFTVDTSFRMTAPMDMIGWPPLRRLVRRTIFRPDRALLPFLATEIVLAATR